MKSQTSLGKALRLLFAIGETTNPAGISVAELMRATKVSRPTAYRFLNELEQFGLVRSVPKQPMWQLGPKVIALAAQAGSWAIMRRRAKVAMEEFVQSGGPTVHLGIRDGNEVVYIDKAESLKFATIASAVGQRRPLNVPALGKCLVAFDANAELAENLADAGLAGRTPNSITDRQRWVAEIAQVRKNGVAHDVEECDVGASCVAAPICDSQGYALAAISISALSIDRAKSDFDRLERKIRQLAALISATSQSHP
jgi:DNA-binding IclR family transcriptional regulator